MEQGRVGGEDYSSLLSPLPVTLQLPRRLRVLDHHAPSPPPPPPSRTCPRCQSNDTKFCYYNNYSLAQPRYYCRACKRHWTHGGIQRDIPTGGRPHKRPTKRENNSRAMQPMLHLPPPPLYQYPMNVEPLAILPPAAATPTPPMIMSSYHAGGGVIPQMAVEAMTAVAHPLLFQAQQNGYLPHYECPLMKNVEPFYINSGQTFLQPTVRNLNINGGASSSSATTSGGIGGGFGSFSLNPTEEWFDFPSFVP